MRKDAWTEGKRREGTGDHKSMRRSQPAKNKKMEKSQGLAVEGGAKGGEKMGN